MRRFQLGFILSFIFLSCQSQEITHSSNAKIGGPCEGCEALLEYGDKMLNSVDTLPLYLETEPKIELTGTVYLPDGTSPAKDVIIYVYHTNLKGIYEKRGDEQGWARRHGFIRGWVKTDTDGQFTFHTFRPAAYPNTTIPQHIHITIKEPGKNEYYIDDVVFDDDPLLTKQHRNFRLRAGSGLVKPVLENGILKIKRDIFLGKNIPDYF